MKNILVTGSNGQLGNELRLLAGDYPQFRFLFTDIEELDITNKEAVSAFIRTNDIHYIVNCAAYTAVDKAEEDEALCFRINHEAVENLAQAATGQGARLLHVSTDYVFDGTSQTPYRETDPVAPQTVYGRSKLAGEKAALRDCPECVIVRTAWLYSSFGNNFVKTMIRLGKEKTDLNVVSDQLGSPTYAADLAKALLTIVSEAENNNFIPGIYHFTDEGKCSWYDFAKTIHRFYGIETCDVHPVSSEEYPAKAKRPHYSVLNKQKIKTTFSVVVPHWEESLQHCIGKLKKEGF
ncbi:MAG: dTDP-4-dehydrorhamnose reductase [Bacteroidales bacterium]|nr:dTDP-4-dehydrorhamnose reductase [Bacteroidales bacterium]